MSPVPSPFRPSAVVEETFAQLLTGRPAPRTLTERNSIQYALTVALRERHGDLNEIDALVTVSVLYARAYPEARHYGVAEADGTTDLLTFS